MNKIIEVVSRKVILWCICMLGLILLWGVGAGAGNNRVAQAQGLDGYHTYYVAPGGNCEGMIPCFSTVQAAVDAVDAPDDVVKIATGIYTGVSARSGTTQLVYISKSLTIQGGYTTTNWATSYPMTQTTTLDAQGQGRVVFITGMITFVGDGLRITNGKAPDGSNGVDGVGGNGSNGGGGGGVYIATGAVVTVTDSTVIGNSTGNGGDGGIGLSGNTGGDGGNGGSGGGIYVATGATATLNSSSIVSNTTGSGGDGGDTDTSNVFGGAGGDGGDGGAIDSRGTLTLVNSAITSNVNGNGGAMGCSPGPLISCGWIGSAGSGGGLRLYQSHNAVLTGNTIASNSAGGVYISLSDNAGLTGNTFISNTAKYGGGLRLSSSDNARLTGNTFTSNNATISGGGIYLSSSDNAWLTDNTVTANTAPSGGGLCLIVSNNAWLTGNTVMSNIASGGGGLVLSESLNTMLINNVFAENQADATSGEECTYGFGCSAGGLALSNSSSTNLLHNTIAYNSGDMGLFVTLGTAALTNTILAGNTVGTDGYGGATILESTLWHDSGGCGWEMTCNNDFTGDPAFVDPAFGDYHIGPTSAARDAGINAGITTDIDGEPRPVGHIYDIGADELYGVIAQRLITDSGQTYTFGDTCARLTFGPGMTGTLNTITITLIHTYPTAAHNGLPRRYDIEGDGQGFEATLSLCYDDQDLEAAGILDESQLMLYRYDAGNHNWIPYTFSTVHTPTNYISATVTAFSTWAIGAATNAPTFVALHRLQVIKENLGWPGAVASISLISTGIWWMQRRRKKIR